MGHGVKLTLFYFAHVWNAPAAKFAAKMDAKFGMLSFCAVLFLVRLPVTTSSNATGESETQKDRRYASELDYPILPPPVSSRHPHQEPSTDFYKFPQHGMENLKPAPTVKSIGLDSQPPKLTIPIPVRYSNAVPKLLMGEQDFSIYAPPKAVFNQPPKDAFQQPPKDVFHQPPKDVFLPPPKDAFLPPPKDVFQPPPKTIFQEDFHPTFSSSEMPVPSQELKSRESHPFDLFQPPRHAQDAQFLHPLSYLYTGAKDPSSQSPNFITTSVFTPTTTIPVYIPASSTAPNTSPSLPGPGHHPENVVQDSRQDFEHVTPRMVRIVSVDVECSMTSMLVHLKFDGPFGGVVYSKGYFNDKLCHYVPYGSSQREYEFVIAINRCGAQFADFTPGGQASLEDIIVVQNEQGIQEIWDTARRIQCTWAGIVEKKVNSAFHVDTLETVAVKYSADTANAYMDIQLGKGPFASPVTGLVKIGDTITVVIAIESPGDVDVRVKECIAHNGDNRRGEEDFQYGRSSSVVRLTDEDGCVLKPKLLSPWRKTRETGSTGANIITFSYLQAFKFPDRMEVYLECTLEICKKQCHSGCHEADSGYPRQKRGVLMSDGPEKGNLTKEQFVLQRTLRVISPEELNLLRNGTKRSRVADGQQQEICLSVPHFVIAIVVIFLAVIASCVATAVISLRKGFSNELRSTILKKTSYVDGALKNP